MRTLLINEDIFGSKGILLQDGKIREIHIEKEEDIVGAIIKGRVTDIINGLDGAFVDIGGGRKGFLHKSEIPLSKESKSKKISEILQKDSEILVEVLSEPQGDKGVKLTMECTLSGKNLIFIPGTNQISISKKIKNVEERARIQGILEELRVEGEGVIVRTQGQGVLEEVFQNEYKYLREEWLELKSNQKVKKRGEIIYNNNILWKKLGREQFTSKIDEVIINNRETYNSFKEYVGIFSNERALFKIKHRSEDLLNEYGIYGELERALEKRVELPSGGYLIIESTEALTTIDVNSGGTVSSGDYNENINKTNLEASEAIPQELVLRGISGIIVIDFIDMKNQVRRAELLKTLELNLKKDRAKTQIIHFSEINLVELTRERVSKPLTQYFRAKCEHCLGLGTILSEDFIMERLFGELKTLSEDKDYTKIKVELTSDFYKKIGEPRIEYFKKYIENGAELVELECEEEEDKKESFFDDIFMNNPKKSLEFQIVEKFIRKSKEEKENYYRIHLYV